MEILGRNPTPDRYSITNIRLSWERWDEKNISLYLLVSLEPGYYQRFRGGNLTTEKKENACELRIPLKEFHEMEDTLRRELPDCYQFMGERDLLGDLWTHKHPTEDETKKLAKG